MLNQVHYRLKTTSVTGTLINAVATYDVYYAADQGIAYEVELQVPETMGSNQLRTAWRAKIFNDSNEKRLEYDILQKIYYQTRQTIQVESALYDLQTDLQKFLEAPNGMRIGETPLAGGAFPGFRVNTLTIWYDAAWKLPLRRINLDRGNTITDEFTYFSLNQPLPGEVFSLPKPAEAIADFNLYPEPPLLPRFVNVYETPQYGIYVNLLLEQTKQHIIRNQWEYGPFATIKLPWNVTMPVLIYLRKTETAYPPIIAVFEVPGQGKTYFFINYSYLGYVVTGFTQDPYDLRQYERLPINASARLEDFIPLYQSPSLEKDAVVSNFVRSVQSNDTFIIAFGMGNKEFDITFKNFSFDENEGYLLLNVYGKEYWDNANFEAKFNFVVTGQMADAHTTPLIIYALNSLKRLGINRRILMPNYVDIPVTPPPV